VLVEVGGEYRIIGKGNYHRGKTCVIQEVRGQVALGLVGQTPYPFLPGELEPLQPKPAKPKRATAAKRAAVYRRLLEQVADQWATMPADLQAELLAALAL
jgi:hypothetical protein